jgi:phospholipid/cholesterol/gamma-HCH transport system substrate-binding protein
VIGRPIRRGAVCAMAVGLLAAGCSLPGSTEGPLTITATFTDVGDLVVNHSVQVADVRVGSIKKIELTPDYKAKVTMSVKETGLPADAIAELRTTSLLGEKFIELRRCDATAGDTGCEGGGGHLANHAEIPATRTKQAPELEFVAEQAVQLLGGIGVNDLSTLVVTGSQAFGGRGSELRGLVDDLSTISATLADQTNNVIAIIDGLDTATTTLAGSNTSFDQALVNLAATTKVLADNRVLAVNTVQQLTRLAQAQNQLVFDPYIATVKRQVTQLDAILNEVTKGRSEVGLLVDWLEKFVYKIPQGIPQNFAQIYAWLVPCPGPGC